MWSMTANFNLSKSNDQVDGFVTLEYSCASLLYFVCRSVTFAIVAGTVIPQLIVVARLR